jgi:predicted ATP-grasp superfamily ATP-dependent carboligase
MVEDRYTPLAMCRYVAGLFVNKATDSDSLLNSVQAIGDAIGCPTILLPLDDRGAVLAAEHAQALRRRFLIPHLPAELPRLLANKKSLYSLCRKIGMPCSEYVVPSSIDEVHEFIGHATFPVFVKSGEHSHHLGNRYSGCIVERPKELLALLGAEDLLSKTILQEYIPGQDWVFHGYSNMQTGCFLGFTGKKLRSYPPFAGPTTLGVSVQNDALSEQTKSMLKAIGFSGIVDLDYRRDERDGRYKLVDFNPRVGGNFSMFEDDAGMDVVRALHLDLTGKIVKRAPMIEGRTFIVELHDVCASLAYLRRGEITIRSWLRSLSGKRELAWWSWNDPLPFVAMVARLFLRAAQRELRKKPGQIRSCLLGLNRILSWGRRRPDRVLYFETGTAPGRPPVKACEPATFVVENLTIGPDKPCAGQAWAVHAHRQEEDDDRR